MDTSYAWQVYGFPVRNYSGPVLSVPVSIVRDFEHVSCAVTGGPGAGSQPVDVDVITNTDLNLVPDEPDRGAQLVWRSGGVPLRATSHVLFVPPSIPVTQLARYSAVAVQRSRGAYRLCLACCCATPYAARVRAFRRVGTARLCRCARRCPLSSSRATRQRAWPYQCRLSPDAEDGR
jgi:hypothetical protein